MVTRLTRQILEWRPTLVLLPAAEDADSDHSALHVLVRFALDLIGGKPSFPRNDSGWRAVLVSSRVDRSREVTDRHGRMKGCAPHSDPVTAGQVQHVTGALMQPKFRVADSSLPR